MKSLCLFVILISMAVASPLTDFQKFVLGAANLVNDARNGINHGLDKTLYYGGDIGQHLVDGVARGVYDVSNKIGSADPNLRPLTNKVDYLAIDGAELGHKVLEGAAKAGLELGTGATGLLADAAGKVAHFVVPSA